MIPTQFTLGSSYIVRAVGRNNRGNGWNGHRAEREIRTAIHGVDVVASGRFSKFVRRYVDVRDLSSVESGKLGSNRRAAVRVRRSAS